MEHRFQGEGGTVGIEEELMILDAESGELASEIETLLADAPEGQVTPELLESVLEIASPPCRSIAEAGAELSRLRAELSRRAMARGLVIGASGTHPFSPWEGQRIVARDRYRGLVSDLGFVARQELVFGMHVHVGVGDPEEAIHVANALRPHIPLLVALSVNSPFWLGMDSGLQSSRVPIFRAFPRVGIPPRWGGWADYSRRVGLMIDAGLIGDPTYLWYDVRPHPKLGTVEVRAMDVQTEGRDTLALSALVQCLCVAAGRSFRAGEPAPDVPPEILDDSKWRAARHGMDAELLQMPAGRTRPVRELAGELLERLGAVAGELGCAEELADVGRLIDGGTGAERQRHVHTANHDLHEVVRDIVERSAPA